MSPIHYNNFTQNFKGMPLFSMIAVAVVFSILFFLSSAKFLLVANQSKFDIKETRNWLRIRGKAYKNRLMLLSLMSFLAFCIFNACFIPIVEEDIASYIGIIAFCLFVIVYIKTEANIFRKLFEIKSNRLLRLSITLYVCLLIICFLFVLLLNYISYLIKNDIIAVLRFSILTLFPMLLPYCVIVAEGINSPFEKRHNSLLIKRTTKILYSSKSKKIVVAGSFAKTSVKQMIVTLLKEKYSVLTTSNDNNFYNDNNLEENLLSIAHTVKKGVFADFFVAEIGVKKDKDMKSVCSMIRPSVGVLTGVEDGFSTDKFSEEIKRDMFSLFKYLYGDKIAFFSSENDCSKELFDRFVGDRILAGINGDLICFNNIKYNVENTEFTLCVKGENVVDCKTTLIGKANLSNLAIAVSVAYKMGLGVDEIIRGIDKIQPLEHRLCKNVGKEGKVIIDDSCCNTMSGAVCALDMLSIFSGAHTVVTCGFNGDNFACYEANKKLGMLIAKNADEVIITNNINNEPLKKGLFEGGLREEDVEERENLLSEKQNFSEIDDLPDNDVVLVLGSFYDKFE